MFSTLCVPTYTLHVCHIPAVTVGDDLLPLVGREFPFLHVSPSMMRVMWQKQVAQIQALTKSGTGQSGRGLCKKVREMERRHEALLTLIRKEVLHTQRMVSVNPLSGSCLRVVYM